MTRPLAILTDIEGTTSSIDFVHEVLFPYARKALPDYIRKHRQDADVAPLLDQVRETIGRQDATVEQVVEALLRWIDEDRKATPLKALQGLVWEHGYRNGDFTGHVYDDAVRNLRRWAEQNIELYVYSSGSVQAQELLFGYSDAGDLRPLFSGYFDTRVGQKREVASYRAIARHIGHPVHDILFLSDVVEELDAAAAVGMRTIHVVRGAEAPDGRHPVVDDFDSIIF
ncbi:MAG: acireductone synthase [Woeseia sp.]